MKIAVISDIHGNIDALEAVVGDLARRGIGRVINLGDCLAGPLAARATADRLMVLGWPTVRGNHDRWLYDRPVESMGQWESWIVGELDGAHFDWLRSFPATLEVEGIFACHATPGSDEENWLDHRGPSHGLVARDLDGVRERLGDVDAQLVACGHTHTPRVVRLPGGPLIVNPGSVGVPAYLDTRTEPPFVHQTGLADARYAVLERLETGWSADLVHVPYDPSAMIALATRRGANTWATALAQGWFA